MSRQKTKTDDIRREHYFTKMIENAERGIYHVATTSRHIKMPPPIMPSKMKLMATIPTVPAMSYPCGTSHTNIRRMPKGIPQHSHT